MHCMHTFMMGRRAEIRSTVAGVGSWQRHIETIWRGIMRKAAQPLRTRSEDWVCISEVEGWKGGSGRKRD